MLRRGRFRGSIGLHSLRLGDTTASDTFIDETLLSRRSRGTRTFRLMDAIGAFGLSHLWVYDRDTIARTVSEAGFAIDDALVTPSDHVRVDDGVSVHIRAKP